jgi:hypothetical protein
VGSSCSGIVEGEKVAHYKAMLQPTHTLNSLSQFVDSTKYSAHFLENTKSKNTDNANSNFAFGNAVTVRQLLRQSNVPCSLISLCRR